MKLEVGQFVRIKNKAGWYCIGKLYNINDFREPSMKYCIDIQKDDFIFVPEDMIVKASNNIIDLIEPGDYVNELPVESYYTRYDEEKDDYIKIGIITLEDYWKGTFTSVEDIKSIVTKEQFESVSYKVGE